MPRQLYTISSFDAEGDSGDGTKGWTIACGLISTIISGVLAFLQVWCRCFYAGGGVGGGGVLLRRVTLQLCPVVALVLALCRYFLVVVFLLT